MRANWLASQSSRHLFLERFGGWLFYAKQDEICLWVSGYMFQPGCMVSLLISYASAVHEGIYDEPTMKGLFQESLAFADSNFARVKHLPRF